MALPSAFGKICILAACAAAAAPSARSAASPGPISDADYAMELNAGLREARVTPASAGRAIPNTRIRHADGTVTILRPAVRGRWLSVESDLNGACRFYGFRKAVAAKPAPLPIAAGPAVIDSEGNVAASPSPFGGYFNSLRCL